MSNGLFVLLSGHLAFFEPFLCLFPSILLRSFLQNGQVMLSLTAKQFGKLNLQTFRVELRNSYIHDDPCASDAAAPGNWSGCATVTQAAP